MDLEHDISNTINRKTKGKGTLKDIEPALSKNAYTNILQWAPKGFIKGNKDSRKFAEIYVGSNNHKLVYFQVRNNNFFV